MTEAGMASNELSKRSSIPPCPGRILPLSLICNCRFRRLSTRSPHVPNITTVSASPNHSHLPSDGSKQAKICDAATATNPPPTEPSHDLFGEIRGNSL